MKIGLKLILGFLLIISTFLAAEYFSIYTSQKELQNSIGESTVSMANDLIDDIDRNIYTRVEECQHYSRGLLLQEAVAQSNDEFAKMGDAEGYINRVDQEWTSAPKDEITPFMQELLSNAMSKEFDEKVKFYEAKYGYALYGEIFVTNKYGANVAQSDKTSDYNQADEEWWQTTKRDGFYITDAEYDESSGVYSTAIGVRVDDDNGSFMGAMKNVLNIEEVFNMIRETIAGSKYKSMAIKLVNKNGRIVYDSEGNFKLFEDVSNEGFFKEIGSGRGYFLKSAERNESDELFAYAHSQGYKEFKGVGWIVVVEYDASEIQEPMARLGYAMVVASFAGLLLAVLLGFFIYRSISRPITQMRDATNEIGMGHLEKKISITSKDEIGELASAFNQMTKDLKKSRSKIEKYSKTLESQVSNRTKKLNRKVHELTKARTALLNITEDLEQANKELVKTQTQLRGSIRDIKKLDLEKDKFISIAAHELKTPMTAIHGFAQLLENEKIIKSPERRRKYLKIIEKEIERLSELVTDVLDLSRIDLGTLKLTIEDVDIIEFMEEIKYIMTRRVSEAGLKIDFAVDKTLPIIATDKEKLTEVMINLIDNAIKYTERGGIKVDVNKEGEYMQFSVSDTGIGIQKKYFSKMFTRFYQVASPLTRKAGGSGLGLSICKEYVERLGGKIWLKSKVGKGTTLFFTLPIKLPRQRGEPKL